MEREYERNPERDGDRKFEDERRYGKRREHKRRKRKVKRQMRPGCLISVVVVFLACIILFVTPIFNVKQVVVENNVTVKTDEIITKSGLKIGDNLFRANTGAAEKMIQQIPFVESVKVTRVLPDKIKITVTEGTVAAYVKHDTKYIGINKDGQTLCSLSKASIVKEDSTAPKAPLVKGINVTKSEMGKKVEVKETGKFETLLKMLKTFSEKGISTDITAVDITKSKFIVLKYRDNLTINFGDATKYDYKFNLLMGFLEDAGADTEGELNIFSVDDPSYGAVKKQDE